MYENNVFTSHHSCIDYACFFVIKGLMPKER